MHLKFCLRLTAVSVFILAPFADALAESFDLRPQLRSGQCSDVELLVEVAGELRLPDQTETKTVPMQVRALTRYEQAWVLGTSQPTGPRRAIRFYEPSAAKLQVDAKRFEPKLDDAHRLVIADWSGERLNLYLADGHLTRDELDLIHSAGDSAMVDAFLPDGPVAIGDRWEFMPEVLAALLGLDAVNTSEVEAELKEVDGSSAKCELSGKLSGGVGGVGSEIELKAKFTFDLPSKQITWLAMLVKEKREIGHATPGVEATTRLQMKISPLSSPTNLPATYARANVEPRPDRLLLSYVHPDQAFSFLYDRRWQMMSESETGAAFRLVDQGDLIAQLNALPLKPSPTGRPIELSAFQEDIQRAIGDNFGQFVTAAQNADRPGKLLYRVVCTGTANDLPIQWNYHLVSSPTGEQSLLIFTLEADLVERFADEDQRLVDTVTFGQKSTETATRSRLKR